MTSSDLIFSNHVSYRISRHVLFWVCWLLFIYLTYWSPNFHVVFAPFYSDWNLRELLKRVDKWGGWYTVITRSFFRSWYKGFLGQMVFTYGIIYVALPLYFSSKRRFTPIIITLLLLCFYAVFQYLQMHTAYANAFKRGDRPHMPDPRYIVIVVAKSFSYILPILVGVAVTIKLLKRWWLKEKEAEQIAR